MSTIDDPLFAHDQRVQEAIALIQKVTRLSIMQINEKEIHDMVWKGRTPCQIARTMALAHNRVVMH